MNYARHVQYENLETQWVRGGNPRLPVNAQDVSDVGGKICIAMCPEEMVNNWERKACNIKFFDRD